MTKTRAALIHLWPSILLLGIIAGLILFVWYPYPFLQFKDTGKFSLLLVICGVLIGPVLTWLFYKQGKWGLLFDLVVIVLIQSAAVSWGTRALYLNRPYFMVFTVDRFEVLSVRDVDITHINDMRFLDKPFASPVLLYANMPKDEQTFQKLIKEIMFEGKPDLQYRPEFWSLYADRQQLALKVSQPLEKLRSARPEIQKKIDRLVNNNGGSIDQLKFVPALLQNGQFAAILDANTGEYIDALITDPWTD